MDQVKIVSDENGTRVLCFGKELDSVRYVSFQASSSGTEAILVLGDVKCEIIADAVIQKAATHFEVTDEDWEWIHME